jgi:phage terminase large subunit-like protein
MRALNFNYSEVARQYAKDVVDNKVLANKWVKLACRRHLEDLANVGKEGFDFKFVEAKANKPCAFIERLPHVAGKWAARKEYLVLQPWQLFIVCSLFGWIDKDDTRRYRKAYIAVPRKNAKSTLAAAIGLYMLCLDGEFGAQVYSGATTEKQANFVFDPAKKMAKSLGAYLGVEVAAISIMQQSTNSRFERLIGNPGDGGSPSCAIVDEFHEADDSALYDTMVTGTGARDQALILVITTAGFNTGGPCFLMQRQMERMLEGTVDLPNTFALMYGIDEADYEFNGEFFLKDDWTTEQALIKACPNWGISVNSKNILAEQKEAIDAPEKQNTFKTKYLNVWCSARAGFFNVEKFRVLGDRALIMCSERFLGKPCIKGLDLASQIDICADVMLFEEKVGDLSHYFVFPKFYCPEITINDPKNQHYLGWFNKDMLIGTESDETDYLLVKKNILKDAEKFQVKELCFDKYQATFMKQQIIDETNMTAVEVPQNAETFSPQMERLRAMITSGRLHHDGNEMMEWMIGNVVSKENGNELHFPRKEKPEFKIDGVTALLNALTRAVAVFGEPEQKYRTWNGF